MGRVSRLDSGSLKIKASPSKWVEWYDATIPLEIVNLLVKDAPLEIVNLSGMIALSETEDVVLRLVHTKYGKIIKQNHKNLFIDKSLFLKNPLFLKMMLN